MDGMLVGQRSLKKVSRWWLGECTVGGAGAGVISDYYCFGYQFSDMYRLERCTLFERVKCGYGSFAVVWKKKLTHILIY